MMSLVTLNVILLSVVALAVQHIGLILTVAVLTKEPRKGQGVHGVFPNNSADIVTATNFFMTL
jgi:hypothetical protein